jgi:hypothetical protein
VNRRKPLQARAELNRGKGLGRAGLLERSAGLAPVSKKRQRENRTRKQMAAAMFPGRPLCAVYVLFQQEAGLIPGKVTSRCKRWADDLHEPLTRARGGSITDPENAEALCRHCHEALGLEPPWGYETGLLRHSWQPKGEAA